VFTIVFLHVLGDSLILRNFYLVEFSVILDFFVFGCDLKPKLKCTPAHRNNLKGVLQKHKSSNINYTFYLE